MIFRLSQKLADKFDEGRLPALQGMILDGESNGKTFKITDITVLPSEKTLDLSIKFSVASTADFSAVQADARSLATAAAW